jgi:hypothetical protein
VRRTSNPKRSMPKEPASPEMASLGRIRGMASWVRKTGKHPKDYPKISAMSGREIFDARQFAVGGYPWPTRWTLHLVELARSG